MSSIFISYAHSDVDEARRLVMALQELHIAGWLDASDVTSGKSLSSAVRNALNASSAVIVLLSPLALHSEWVQFEIGAAEALGKKIIPIIVSGDHLEEQLPDILTNRVWIDARHRPHEDVVRDVKREVESVLE